MEIKGNTVLVTGGTSGIGLEFASQLLDLGNTVLITGRDQARLDAAQKKLPKVRTFLSDVSDVRSITALFERVTKEFPDLNVLINNAGIMRKINLNDPSNEIEGLTREIDTNLSGPIRMVQKFLPQLKSRKHAAIVNVSSGLAFVPFPLSPVYSATKAALHAYTLSLRVQLKRSGVQVFELAPPLTDTPLLGNFDPKDMEGVPAMPVAEMVRIATKGMSKGTLEIRPGSSNFLKTMSRIAPGLALGMLSKPVNAMLARDNF